MVNRLNRRTCDRAAEVAMLKYMEILRFHYHDSHRHEQQTDVVHGGLPGVLRAKGSRVLRLGRFGGAWWMGSIRGRRPRGGRSIRSPPTAPHARAKTTTGGELIPEETDPGDPAPRALAPEEL